MGPSGCGKSTLINVLRGVASEYGDLLGSMRLNGFEVPNLKGLVRATGFVPQFDILHEEMKVSESIKFSGRWRLAGEEQGALHPTVDAVIEVLDLEKVANQQVIFVSGGQRCVESWSLFHQLFRRIMQFGV